MKKTLILACVALLTATTGFIYPNEPVSGSFKKRVVTVDEVERRTGLDFFSSLPDNVENALESHSDPDHWSN